MASRSWKSFYLSLSHSNSPTGPCRRPPAEAVVREEDGGGWGQRMLPTEAPQQQQELHPSVRWPLNASSSGLKMTKLDVMPDGRTGGRAARGTCSQQGVGTRCVVWSPASLSLPSASQHLPSRRRTALLPPAPPFLPFNSLTPTPTPLTQPPSPTLLSSSPTSTPPSLSLSLLPSSLARCHDYLPSPESSNFDC